MIEFKRMLLKKYYPIIIEVVLVVLVALLAHTIDFSNKEPQEFYFRKRDIYYEYQYSKDIQKGKNPYLKILDSNMLENEKYATQLPLYFYLLAYIRDLSHNDFGAFIKSWRNVIFYSQIFGGLMLYIFFRDINKKVLGAYCALIYIFNVWSLNSIIVLKQDMPALLLLLVSLYFFKNSKYRWLSYIFYGLSLGVKHIGIFIAPLYLTPLILKKDNIKVSAVNISLLLITLVAPTIPLLIDNPLALIKSMLFSITRSPTDSEVTYGYSNLLITYNPSYNTGTLFQQILPRLPLLLASVFSLVLLYLKKLGIYTYTFLAILVFAIFNPVIYPQYITWVIPMALLSLVEITLPQKS